MNMSRRAFLGRGALAAAGAVAMPMWAQWMGEQIDRMQFIKRRITVQSRPKYTISVEWIYSHEYLSPDGGHALAYALSGRIYPTFVKQSVWVKA